MSASGPRVKNKGVAPIQVTAEQLLRESFDRADPGVKAPKHRISDAEELKEYQGRQRKMYEDRSRINPGAAGNWMRYATWELQQKEFARARSVFERGLDECRSSVPLWLKYIESEVQNRNINHARNVYDRAVTNLHRVDTFWFKYAAMEETLGNVIGTRQIFERWMQWEPKEEAWVQYINFEKRYSEIARARALFERFTIIHPEPKTWLQWAKFESDSGDSESVRRVYELAIETLGEEFMDENLFIAYARFETSLKEYERAGVIYRYALDRMSKSSSRKLYNEYTKFVKQFGSKDDIEAVVRAKQRSKYEEQVKQDPKNYDTWLAYLRMEEDAHETTSIRQLYERAVAQVPESQVDKRDWQRYIYIWLNYAIFEELETQDFERVRDVYRTARKLVEGTSFTFAKLSSAFAHFELRQSDVSAAREIFERAVEKYPKKDKLYKDYIAMEISLKEFDLCREVYQKFIEFNVTSSLAWMQYARLETELGDDDRARAIYEGGIRIEGMDMSDLLWKSYIDFEFENQNFIETRRLYEKLLKKEKDVKYWIAFAQFELSVPADPEDQDGDGGEDSGMQSASERCRAIFQRAHEYMCEANVVQDRVVLLDSWSEFERDYGTTETRETVARLMPKQVKKIRELEDGSREEYFDYLFPSDDQKTKSSLSLLAAANAWKEKEAQKTAGAESQD